MCFSVISQSSSSFVVVLRPRSEIARFARWKEDERRKQALGVSLLPPEKRTRTKDDDEDDWEMTLNTYACLVQRPRNRPVGYGMIGRSSPQRCFSSKWAPCFL